MKYMVLILLSLINTACAQSGKPSGDLPSKLVISQGEVRWLEFPIPKEDSKLVCRDQEVKFVKKGRLGLAFIMESYFSDFSPFRLCQTGCRDHYRQRF